MQPHEKQDLIEYRILKAKETLEDAKLAIDNNRFRTAFNRIYYLIFYIVSALAIQHDYSTSKHKQLMGWFNFNFVKTGIISIDSWKTYKNSFDKRQESDYDDFVEFLKSDVDQYFEDLLLFISEIEKIIKMELSHKCHSERNAME